MESVIRERKENTCTKFLEKYYVIIYKNIYVNYI